MKKNVYVSEIVSALKKNTKVFEKLRKNTVVISPILLWIKGKFNATKNPPKQHPEKGRVSRPVTDN